MIVFTKHLTRAAELLVKQAMTKNVMIVTAESCTGGLIASLITEIPGASQVFERGFISYSYESKTEILGVSVDIIKKHGSVSVAVCRQMAIGALENSNGDIAIAVTGIAGPGGGTIHKPVGLVHLATANKKTGKVLDCKYIFQGSRHEVRLKTVEFAIAMMIDSINSI